MDERAPDDVVVFYDADCGFCVRALRVLQRLDRGGVLRYEDANAPDVIARYPQLAGADFTRAMYAFDGAQVEAGFFAVRRALRALPGLRPLAALLALPAVPWVGTRVYALVARNRRKLGCTLPTRPL